MTTSSPRDALLAKAIEHFSHHGVGDTSMRTLASSIGTSQRMLHYHFGSREDLLAAVVEAVVSHEVEQLRSITLADGDPFAAARHHWARVADSARIFGGLFFELSAHAMYGHRYATHLGGVLTVRYAAVFEESFTPVMGPDLARVAARLSLAVGRGLLFDVLMTGDRAAADAAVDAFALMGRYFFTSMGAMAEGGAPTAPSPDDASALDLAGAWGGQEWEVLTAAHEVQVVAHRTDGSERPPMTVWIVGASGRIFVRSERGRSAVWFRRAMDGGVGRLIVDGTSHDVAFTPAQERDIAAVDAAYSEKYAWDAASCDDETRSRIGTLEVRRRGVVQH